MRSIKPGRGPSFMGGIMSIAVGLFGVLWTFLVASMGGGMFALFGVIFVAVAIVQAVYNFKNATSDNRYSAFDITTDSEEPDPLNERFGSPRSDSCTQVSDAGRSEYCPYCGVKVSDDYLYCSKCGKKLPEGNS